MNSMRTGLVTSLSLGLLLVPRLSQAEEGEFQVGLGTPLLVYSKVTTKTEFEQETSEATSSGPIWGIGHNVVGELGYGVTPNILVGGLFTLSGGSNTYEDEAGNEFDSSSFGLFLGPKLDYVLLPGDKVQPFVGAVVGIDYSSASFGENNDSSLTGFEFMGRFGIRAFPGKEFSMDPALIFSYFTGSGEEEAGMVTSDVSVSGYQVGIMVAISGWMD